LYGLSQVIDEILFRLNILYRGIVLNHTLYKPYTGSFVDIEADAAAVLLSHRKYGRRAKRAAAPCRDHADSRNHMIHAYAHYHHHHEKKKKKTDENSAEHPPK
jgi:hypothetical protein